MKNAARICFGLFLLAIMFSAETLAQQSSGKTTGIVTLYVRDALAQTFCFRDGEYGAVIQENELRNRCSDLAFNSYSENGFSAGIEGGRIGRILNLGSPQEIQRQFGYSETVGNGQGFASIHLENGKIQILKDRMRIPGLNGFQELTGAAELFKANAKSNDSLPVIHGSIYILRLTDRHDKTFERIVKILVVGFEPNESVTFRWKVIFDSESQTSELGKK